LITVTGFIYRAFYNRVAGQVYEEFVPELGEPELLPVDRL